MPGLIPAMRDCAGVGEQAGPGRERRELDVGVGAGHAESEIQRARARVKDQRGVEQVGFVEKLPLFTTFRKAMNSRKAMPSPTITTRVVPLSRAAVLLLRAP